MKRLSGVLSVVVCLLLVGLIRSAVPDYTPSEYDVFPDDDGVGHHEEYTVELRGFWLADELTHQDTFGPEQLTTENVFMVMRARVTPYQRTLLATTELITADGYTYSAVAPYPFPSLSVAYVGQTTTVNFIFELPPDKVEGAFVTFHGLRKDGIQPMWPRLRFDVVDATVVDTLDIPDNTVQPRR